MSSITNYQKELIENAEFNHKKTLKVGNFEYPINSTEGIFFMHHIETYGRQKLYNDLAIKLVKYQNDYINYIGLLKNPTASNPCINKNRNETLCYCNGECKPCFVPKSDRDSIIYYVPVNFGENPVTKSKGCFSHDFYKPYLDMDRLDLGLIFIFKDANLFSMLVFN